MSAAKILKRAQENRDFPADQLFRACIRECRLDREAARDALDELGCYPLSDLEMSIVRMAAECVLFGAALS